MKKIKKFNFIVMLLLSFFFSTGFLGGENAKDAIKDIIQALENNDATLFRSRVPQEYWTNIIKYMEESGDVNNAFSQRIKNSSEIRKAYFSARNKKDEEATSIFLSAINNFMIAEVSSGEMANLSRASTLSFLPFAPEILEKLEYGKETKIDGESFYPATATYSNGQKFSYAFAEVDDKMLLLGQGGNSKAAIDSAVTNRNTYIKLAAAKKEAQEAHEKALALRKKHAKDFQGTMAKQFLEVSKLSAKEKKDEAENLANALYRVLLSYDKINLVQADRTLQLDSPEFLKQIEQGLLLSLPSVESDNRKKLPDAADNDFKVLFSKPYIDFHELVWQKGDFAIVKFTYFKDSRKLSEQELTQRYNEWLEFLAKDAFSFYALYKEEDDIWTQVAIVGNVMGEAQVFYPFSNSTALEYNPEEYLTLLAKNYDKLYASAKKELARLEKIEAERLAALEKAKKEKITQVSKVIIPMLSSMEKAVSGKNIDEISKYLDFNTFALCATNYASCADTNALKEKLTSQVDPIAKYIRNITNTITRLNPNPIWNKEVIKTAELHVIDLKNPNIILALQTKNEKKYFLLAPYEESYKIIAENKDRSLLEKNSFTLAIAMNYAHLYKANEAQLFLRGLSSLLNEKKYEDYIKNFDFDSIRYWVKFSAYENARQQAYHELFPEFSENNITKKSSLAQGALEALKKHDSVYGLNSARLSDAKFIHVSNKSIVLQYQPNLYFFFVKEGNAFIGKSFYDSKKSGELSSYTLRSFENNAKSRSERVYSEYVNLEKKYASMAVVAGMLDFLKIENSKYSVYQDGNSMKFALEMSARNTYKENMLASSFCLYFQDKEGKNYNFITFNGDRRTPIPPEKAISHSTTLSINEKMMFFLEKVRKGDMQIVVSPYRIEVGEENNRHSFERFYENSKVVPVTGGMWQYNRFPPAKITRGVYMESRQAQEDYYKNAQEERDKNIQKSIPYVEKIFSAVTYAYDKTTNKLTIKNSLEQQITVEYQLSLLDANDTILKSNTFSERIKPQSSIEYALKAYQPSANSRLEVSIKGIRYHDMRLKKNSPYSYHGTIMPLLYQQSPILFTSTDVKTGVQKESIVKKEEVKAIAASKKEIAKTKTQAVEEKSVAKAEEKKEVKEEVKAVTEDKTSTQSTSSASKLIAPEAKKPGVAVIMPYDKDSMSFDKFVSDNKNDSLIKVLAKGNSPIIAIRLENRGGVAGSWKTKDVKTSAMGIIKVENKGTVLNPNNATFSVDVKSPVELDLIVQDNGAIADKTNKMRITFFHEDGTRTYAIAE